MVLGKEWRVGGGTIDGGWVAEGVEGVTGRLVGEGVGREKAVSVISYE